MKAAILLTLYSAFFVRCFGAQPSPFEEVAFGYLPAQAVTTTVKKVLSPQGRFVILPATGMVRIYDSSEHIQVARRALEEMQRAPANVSIEIKLTTGQRRVVRRSIDREPVLDYEVPIPQNYNPPRIINNYPGGAFVIVPAQPRNFTTRRAEPGSVVNVGPIGYVTRDSEVRMSESGLEGGTIRRWSSSAVLGKGFVIPVLANVPDVNALREWAFAHHAVSESEPPWTSVGTELVVTPELSNGNLTLSIVPRIAVYRQDRRQPPRLISLSQCATLIPVQRGTPSILEKLSATDAEFYRVFFGARDSSEETVGSLSINAAVRYLGL